MPPPQIRDSLSAAWRAFRPGEAEAAAAVPAGVRTRGTEPAAALARLETPPGPRRAPRETRAMFLRLQDNR